MRLKKTGMFWLRAAAMRQEGFNPGAPWNVNPDYFFELEKAGFVERHYDVDGNTGREYLYAVTTRKGLAVIRDHAARVSGGFLGEKAGKWSERGDLNPGPLSPQENADG